MRCCSNHSSTPTCATPRAPPPLNTRPIFSGLASGVCGDDCGGLLSLCAKAVIQTRESSNASVEILLVLLKRLLLPRLGCRGCATCQFAQPCRAIFWLSFGDFDGRSEPETQLRFGWHDRRVTARRQHVASSSS